MVPRIRTQPLLRLAQSQRHACAPPLRTSTITTLRSIKQRQTLARPFSTSPLSRQDQKQQQHPEPASPPTATISDILPPPTTNPEAATSQPPPPPNPKPKSRLGRRLIFAASFILLGTMGGSSLRVLLAPPPPLVPGSEADKYAIEVLHDQAAKLPIVRTLTADPSWESWDAYNTLTPEHKAQHITAGVLSGSEGVGGYQRVFYNPSTGELVIVIFFGSTVVGWPGVVHGGTLATILDESCGRAAFKQWGGLSGMTAKLAINYVGATLANGFYVVRAKPVSEEELAEADRGKRHYKSFVDASIEDAVSGKVTVWAEGLFVGGRGKDGAAGGDADRVRDENARF
ncbi:HotDog domain-containing protein [Bombardia bombarda]|uniref:HotDog domain-containing protein n=1 Tax=Bombardia bombarda TaxID=252184 RepID=A0AA39X6L4_9PEZI|nr:HotDog domain-containing protein [Bombardia bombarda]